MIKYKEEWSFHINLMSSHREEMFRKKTDYIYFLYLLKKYKARYRINLFAYCLLPDCVELVLQPFDPSNLIVFIQSVNDQYREYFEHSYPNSEALQSCDYCRRELRCDSELLDAIKRVEFLPVEEGFTDSSVQYPYGSLGLRILDHNCGLLDKVPLGPPEIMAKKE